MREGTFLGGEQEEVGGGMVQSGTWPTTGRSLCPSPGAPLPTTPGSGTLRPSVVSAMRLSLSFPQNGQAVVRTKARPSHIMWSPWPGARETPRGSGPLTQGAGLPSRLQLLGGGCPASRTRLGWGLFPRKSQDLA